MKQKPIPTEVKHRALAFLVAAHARRMAAKTWLSIGLCTEMALHQMRQGATEGSKA